MWFKSSLKIDWVQWSVLHHNNLCFTREISLFRQSEVVHNFSGLALTISIFRPRNCDTSSGAAGGSKWRRAYLTSLAGKTLRAAAVDQRRRLMREQWQTRRYWNVGEQRSHVCMTLGSTVFEWEWDIFQKLGFWGSPPHGRSPCQISSRS